VKTLARLKPVFKPDFRKTIVNALREWVGAMSATERESKCVFISRRPYSPLDILTAVEQETPVGNEFVIGLSELQDRMQALNPEASVADLIRRSVTYVAEAGAASA